MDKQFCVKDKNTQGYTALWGSNNRNGNNRAISLGNGGSEV